MMSTSMPNPTDPKSKAKLAGFVAGMLSGGVDLGITLLPLVGAYRQAKASPDWKEEGLKTWLLTDPDASALLAKALADVQAKLSTTTRHTLIVALGGMPLE